MTPSKGSMQRLGITEVMLCIAYHLPQADKARWCRLDRAMSRLMVPVLHKHIELRTGADTTEIHQTIATLERFSADRECAIVKHAANTTRSVQFLPSKLIEREGKLWPDMQLQHKLVETVAKYIHHFKSLVELHWHLPLGYCLGADREQKQAIIDLWTILTGMPSLKRTYLLEHLPQDNRTYGGHLRHLECLRQFANVHELYESHDVGKQHPVYERVDQDWITRIQLGPFRRARDLAYPLLELHDWDVQGFIPRNGYSTQNHYFIELMMPRDCEMY